MSTVGLPPMNINNDDLKIVAQQFPQQLLFPTLLLAAIKSLVYSFSLYVSHWAIVIIVLHTGIQNWK